MTRLILSVVAIALFAAGLILWSTGNDALGTVLFVGGAVVAIYMWIRYPWR